MSDNLKNKMLDFSDKYSNRFASSSGRETKEQIREDRGAASRAGAWTTAAALTYGAHAASDAAAWGAFGSTAAFISTAGVIYLSADALASVVETGFNIHEFRAKKRRVKRFLKSIGKDDINFYSDNKAEKKEAKNFLENVIDQKYSGSPEKIELINKVVGVTPVFASNYGKILRQLYNDFADDSKFDTVREVLKDKGLIQDADINRIRLNVQNNGRVLASTVNEIAYRDGGKVGRVLELLSCDDFSDRIVDINKDYVSRFRSASHLAGSLALTNDQQTQKFINKKFGLTKEQNYVRKGGHSFLGFFNPIMSRRKFKNWLAENDKLIQDGNFDELEARQKEMLEKLSKRNPKEKQTIEARLKNHKIIWRAVSKAAKQTEEFKVTSWKRNLFPITKFLGIPVRKLINNAQDKLYYKGELKAHKKVARLEKETKLKHADVYCENGTGFRKIRKDYKKAGYNDFIVEYNALNENKLPNSFACGYITDKKYFEKTQAAILRGINEVQTKLYSKELEGLNGGNFVATCYLDDPVVITVNGQNFDGKKSLPLATINVDQRHVLNSAVVGILLDLARDENDFRRKVNNITFTSGGRTRTIYANQINSDIDVILSSESERFSKTNCAKMIENITRDEPFFRAYKTGFIQDRIGENSEGLPLFPESNEILLPEAINEENKNDNGNDEGRVNPPAPVLDPNNNITGDATITVIDDPDESDDELNLLLLKRDLLELKKKKNQRIDFAQKQLDLKEKLDYSKLDEAKQLENLKQSAAKEYNKELNEKINKLLETISEKLGTTQALVDAVEQEKNAATKFIAKLEKDIENNAIQNVSSIRKEINEYKDVIETWYRDHLQNTVAYAKNEATGKRSNLYSKLNGNLRKEYSETVTKPRQAKEAEINKDLGKVNKEIEEAKKKRQTSR